MRIEVIGSAEEAREPARFAGRTAVVFDVLRATSTIVKALAAGAAAVIPAETVEEALRLRRPGDLLGGERACRRIDGFDLGNSPAEYTPGAVAGRRIVLTTTNGTVALRRASSAETVFAGSLINASACADAAAAQGRDIVLVCAGREGAYALEDGFAAGCLLARLDAVTGGLAICDELGVSLRWMYARHARDAEALLARGGSGRRLAALGMEADIGICAAVDSCRIVPRLHDGELTLAPSAPEAVTV